MSEFVTCTTQKWIFENILVFKLLISMMTALAAQGMTVICLFVMVMWSPAPVNKGRAQAMVAGLTAQGIKTQLNFLVVIVS